MTVFIKLIVKLIINKKLIYIFNTIKNICLFITFYIDIIMSEIDILIVKGQNLILSKLNEYNLIKKRKNIELQDNFYRKKYKKITIDKEKLDVHLTKLLNIIRNTSTRKEDLKKAFSKIKECIYEGTIKSIIDKDEQDEKIMLEKYGPFEIFLLDNI